MLSFLIHKPSMSLPHLVCLFDLRIFSPLREKAHLKMFGFKMKRTLSGMDSFLLPRHILFPPSNFILWGQGKEGLIRLVCAGARESCFGVGAYMGLLMHTHVHVHTCGYPQVHTHTCEPACTDTREFLNIHVHVCICGCPRLHTHTGPLGGDLHPLLCFKQPCDARLRRREAVCFTCRKLAEM